MSMESYMGLVRGSITVMTLLAFLGICWWAYRPSSRERFERDAELVFDPDELPVREERQP